MKVKLLALALLPVLITACNNDDETTTEQSYSNCINFVTDNLTGEQNLSTEGSYTIKFNYTASTADISVKNLRLTSDGSLINFDLTGLSWAYDSDGVKKISATSVTPTSNGSALSGYTVENLSFSMLDRYMNTGEYIPVINMSMTINGEYALVVVPSQLVYFGSTVVTTLASGSIYTNDIPYYLINFDASTQTASIGIVSAQFAEEMPEMDMIFAGIDFTLAGTSFSLNCDSLIPTVGGTPYPDYEITDLSGWATYSGGGTLSFNCASAYSVQVTMTNY